jgi:hypothetical protein
MAERDDLVELIVQLSADTRKMERQFERLTAKSRQQTREIEGMWRRAGSNIDRSFGRLRTFGTGFAGGAVAGILADIDNSLFGIIDKADQLVDTADAIGLTTDELQKLQVAIRKTGGEPEAVGKGMDFFNRQLGLARRGIGDVAKMLADAEIALRDANGAWRDNHAVLQDVVAALAAIEDEEGRRAVAQELFGRAAGEAFANMAEKGVAGIREIIAEAERMGEIVRADVLETNAALKDEVDEFRGWANATFQVLTAGFGVLVAGIVKAVRDGIPPVKDGFAQMFSPEDMLASWRKALTTDFPRIVDQAGRAESAFNQLWRRGWEAIWGTPEANLPTPRAMPGPQLPGGLSAEDIEKTSDAWNQLSDAIEESNRPLILLKQAEDEALTAAERLDALLPLEDTALPSDRLDAILRETEGYNELEGSVRKYIEAQQEAGKLPTAVQPDLVATGPAGGPAVKPLRTPEEIKADTGLPAMQEAVRQWREEVRILREEADYLATETMGELQRAFYEQIALTEEDTQALRDQALAYGMTAAEGDRFLKTQELLRLAQEAGLASSPEVIAAIERVAGAYARAGEDMRQAGQSSAELEQLWQSVGSTLADALANARINGEDLNDVLKNLAASLARLLINSAFQSIFSSVNPFGGIGGGAARANAPVPMVLGAVTPAMAPAHVALAVHTTSSPLFDTRVAAISEKTAGVVVKQYDKVLPRRLQDRSRRGYA